MTPPATFRFRLYVAGNAQNAAQAVVNLGNLCREHLAGRHEIEVVDVYLEPQRALAESIFLTPTLIKLAPTPAPRRIVGNLSQKLPLMQALGLDGRAA